MTWSVCSSSFSKWAICYYGYTNRSHIQLETRRVYTPPSRWCQTYPHLTWQKRLTRHSLNCSPWHKVQTVSICCYWNSSNHSPCWKYLVNLLPKFQHVSRRSQPSNNTESPNPTPRSWTNIYFQNSHTPSSNSVSIAKSCARPPHCPNNQWCTDDPADTDTIPTIIQIPKQIQKQELLQLMPLEWLTNYEQFHQNSEPVQTSQAVFERWTDRQVKLSFQTPDKSSPDPPRLSYTAMITAVPTGQESNLPIYGFPQKGIQYILTKSTVISYGMFQKPICVIPIVPVWMTQMMTKTLKP